MRYLEKNLLALATTAALVTSICAQSPENSVTTEAVADFRRMSARQQQKVLAAMREAVHGIQDPYLDSVRKLVAAGVPGGGERIKTRRKRQKGGGLGSHAGALPFPVSHQYAFGFQVAVPVEPPGKKLSRTRRDQVLRAAELEAMLTGYLPGMDVALANLMYRLDQDRTGDALSKLFETWRNGSESFYHALDRTAGTKDSVFFYDAMLDDFIKKCVPKKHPDRKKLRRAGDDAHDALHQSFLTYRQYRAFREAVALALLLPPQAKLPQSLRRYEQAGSGQYSLRQQIDVLLRAADQNLEQVIAAIVQSAPPLPETLWAQRYEPFPAVAKLIDAQQAAIFRFANHTDKVVQQQADVRAALQQRVARAAYSAFLTATGRATR